MQQVSGREQLWSVTRRWKQEGRVTALVPTMGNLHEGHLDLVRKEMEVHERLLQCVDLADEVING